MKFDLQTKKNWILWQENCKPEIGHKICVRKEMF